MPRKKTVTLHTLAQTLGLSSHTVSKALRGLPGMSEETRKAVLDAARKHGYLTKNQQRSLAVDRIPVFMAKPFRFLFIYHAEARWQLTPQLLQGIQKRMTDLGHQLEAVAMPAQYTHRTIVDECAEKQGLLYADGMFLAPGLPVEFERQLVEWSLPKVMVNFPPLDAKADSVIWDVGTAIYQSVRYLHTNGHRNIMYIGSHEPYRGFRQRWIAFLEAMKEHGLDTDPHKHMIHQIHNKDEWVRVLADMLGVYKPTGLLCGLTGDLPWVYEACRLTDLSIPEHMALITLEAEKSDIPSDTSRAVLPIKEVSERAVDRMLWRIGNPSLPYEHIRIQGHFYEGNTVRPIHHC